MMASVSGNFRRKVVLLSHPSLNVDRAFQAVQHGLHHVQADAATRDLGDLVRGAEPGPEDQCKNFSFSQPVRFVRGEKAFLHGLGFDFVRVNAGPVVGNFHDNLIAVVIRSEMDGSARRLSVSHPLFGALDAMTDGIADQVGQRFGDNIEKTLVQIGLLAAHHQCHFLAALLGHVAHHPGKAAEQLLDRHHADFHDRTLQVAEHARLKRHGIAEAAAQGFLGNVTGEFSECLLQHGPADNQFADQVEHAVNALGVHAQNVFREHRMIGLAGRRMFFAGLRRTGQLCDGDGAPVAAAGFLPWAPRP